MYFFFVSFSLSQNIRNVLKHEKYFSDVFNFFFEKTIFLGPERFCESDSETLTSTSRAPVGLSSNPETMVSAGGPNSVTQFVYANSSRNYS